MPEHHHGIRWAVTEVIRSQKRSLDCDVLSAQIVMKHLIPPLRPVSRETVRHVGSRNLHVIGVLFGNRLLEPACWTRSRPSVDVVVVEVDPIRGTSVEHVRDRRVTPGVEGILAVHEPAAIEVGRLDRVARGRIPLSNVSGRHSCCPDQQRPDRDARPTQESSHLLSHRLHHATKLEHRIDCVVQPMIARRGGGKLGS